MRYMRLAMGEGEVNDTFLVRVGSDLKESLNGGSDKDLFPIFYLYTFFTTLFLQLPFSIINHTTLSLNLALESRSSLNPIIWLQFLLDLTSVFLNPITRPVESFKQFKNHFKTAIGAIILGLSSAGAAYYFGYLAFAAEFFAEIAFLISATLAWEIIIGIALILYLPSLCGQIIKFIDEFNKDENITKNSITQKKEPPLFEEENKVVKKIEKDEELAKNYNNKAASRNPDHMLSTIQRAFPHLKITNITKTNQRKMINTIGNGVHGKVWLNDDNSVVTKIPNNATDIDPFNELSALTASEAGKTEGKETYIIGFYGCSNIPGIVLVLEAADMNLTDLINKGKLQDGEIDRITIEIAEGLRYLHDVLRLIHSDLKTDNILLTKTGTVKIADFGSAKALTLQDSEFCNSYNGTPNYSAPERLLCLPENHLPVHLKKDYTKQYGKSISKTEENITYNSEACDIYSLGGIRFAMESGEQPYRADTNRMTLTQITAYLIMSKGNPLEYHNQNFGGVENIKKKGFSENLMLATWNPDPTKRPTATQVVKATLNQQITF